MADPVGDLVPNGGSCGDSVLFHSAFIDFCGRNSFIFEATNSLNWPASLLNTMP